MVSTGKSEKEMKLLILMIACLIPIPSSSQSQKTISLTVTKITRKQTDTPACENCGSITTVEAHTPTANFILVCEAHRFPDRPKNNTFCPQFNTGVHEVRMIEPDLISFWPEKQIDPPLGYQLYFSVVVEEARQTQ